MIVALLMLGLQGPSDAEKIEALKRAVTALEDRVREQEALIGRLMERLPADDPLRVSMAAAAHPCGRHLKRLWGLQVEYANLHGGRMKAMIKETGPAFWLQLTKTEPPLLAPKDLALLVCPYTRENPRPGFTTYRGPAVPVQRAEGVVGCCDPEDHPDRTLVVLLRGGELTLAKPGEPLYATALAQTLGDPDRQAARDALKPGRAIKWLATAEADFRANDRDENKVQDFWVGDVSGLQRTKQLIGEDLAAADAAPLEGAAKPRPYFGYLYVALKGYAEGGKTLPYHAGDHRNHSRFGFAGYPADYPKNGRLTYLMNEMNTVFARDTGGKPPEAFPSDEELKRDWKKLD